MELSHRSRKDHTIRLNVLPRRSTCATDRCGKSDPPRTQTWNLRLRRPTPHPLGQRAFCLHSHCKHEKSKHNRFGPFWDYSGELKVSRPLQSCRREVAARFSSASTRLRARALREPPGFGAAALGEPLLYTKSGLGNYTSGLEPAVSGSQSSSSQHRQRLTRPGLEPGISGSGGRRLIH